MKTAIAASAAALALAALAADESLPPDVAQAVEPAQAAPVIVDPFAGKVWDQTATEWVPFDEMRKRMVERREAAIGQFPMIAPTLHNGFDVLAANMERERQRWEYILWFHEQQAMPRFK